MHPCGPAAKRQRPQGLVDGKTGTGRGASASSPHGAASRRDFKTPATGWRSTDPGSSPSRPVATNRKVNMATTERDILEAKVLPELQAIASSMGVQGYQRLRKADLIGAIIAKAQGVEFQPSSSPSGRGRRGAAAGQPAEQPELPATAEAPAGRDPEPQPVEAAGNGGQPAAAALPATAQPSGQVAEPGPNGEQLPAATAGGNADAGAGQADPGPAAASGQAAALVQTAPAGDPPATQDPPDAQGQASDSAKNQAGVARDPPADGAQGRAATGRQSQAGDDGRQESQPAGGGQSQPAQGQAAAEPAQGGNVAVLDRPDYRERQQADDRPEVSRVGTLDIRSQDGYGFLRVNGYLPGPEDVYVPLSMIRRMGLRRGDEIEGVVKLPRDSEKYAALVRVD